MAENRGGIEILNGIVNVAGNRKARPLPRGTAVLYRAPLSGWSSKGVISAGFVYDHRPDFLQVEVSDFRYALWPLDKPAVWRTLVSHLSLDPIETLTTGGAAWLIPLPKCSTIEEVCLAAVPVAELVTMVEQLLKLEKDDKEAEQLSR